MKEKPARIVWREMLKDPDAVLDDICTSIAEGTGLLTWVKRKDLTYSVVWSWLDSDARRKRAYQDARITAADALVEEAASILDQELPKDENGRIDPAAVNQLRARAEMRRWQAGKMRPLIYGESVRIEDPGISITLALTQARQRVIDCGDIEVIQGNLTKRLESHQLPSESLPTGNRSPTDD